MPLEMTLPCTSCGLRSQISTMEYSLSGNRLLCQGCSEREQGSFNKQAGTPR